MIMRKFVWAAVYRLEAGRQFGLGRLRRAMAILSSRIRGGRVSWPVSVTAVVPVRCDGDGEVSIADGVTLGFARAPKIGNGAILLQARSAQSRISIGENCHFSNNVSIISMSAVTMGNGCLVGDMALIIDSDFHPVDPVERKAGGAAYTQPVVIGDNVWIGSRVVILKGVTIGDDVVIAAGSVVTQSIPARQLVAGVPARAIRHVE